MILPPTAPPAPGAPIPSPMSGTIRAPGACEGGECPAFAPTPAAFSATPPAAKPAALLCSLLGVSCRLACLIRLCMHSKTSANRSHIMSRIVCMAGNPWQFRQSSGWQHWKRIHFCSFITSSKESALRPKSSSSNCWTILSKSLVQVHPPDPLEFAVCGNKSESGPGESTFLNRLSNDIDVSMLEGGKGLIIAEASGRFRTNKVHLSACFLTLEAPICNPFKPCGWWVYCIQGLHIPSW